MKSIWKYPLPSFHQNQLKLPAGSRPLSVGLQGGDGEKNRMMWALVDPSEKKMEDYCVYVAGTGDKINFPFLDGYIGTIILKDGMLVQHVTWETGKCDPNAFK